MGIAIVRLMLLAFVNLIAIGQAQPRNWLIICSLMVGLMAGLPVQAQQCVPPPSNMVGWWPGDGHTRDLTDRHSPGTKVGNVSYEPGMVDQAFMFDNQGSHLETGQNIHFSWNDPFSISLWLLVDRFPTVHGRTARNVVTDMKGGIGWEFRVMQDPQSGVSRFYTQLTVSNNPLKGQASYGWTARRCQDLLDTDKWHYLAATYNGSGRSDGMKIYVNGQPCSTPLFYQYFIYTFTSPNTSPANLQIGSSLFAGGVDELEIHDRELSPTEILSVYNAGSAGKCRPCGPSGKGYVLKIDQIAVPGDTGVSSCSQAEQLLRQDNLEDWFRPVHLDCTSRSSPRPDLSWDSQYIQMNACGGNTIGQVTIGFEYCCLLTNNRESPKQKTPSIKAISGSLPLPDRTTIEPASKGVCCLQNGRCGEEILKSKCDHWKGDFHQNGSCPTACD